MCPLHDAYIHEMFPVLLAITERLSNARSMDLVICTRKLRGDI